VSFQFNSADSDPPDYKVGEEYLLARGVPQEVTRACGIQFKGPQELSKFAGGNGRCGIVFQYHDVHRQPVDYATVRWIDKRGGFVVVGGRNHIKLSAPAGRVPKPYFPLINDWSKVEPGTRVYFHESALKAINGAILGKFSVGLNGVWGFCSQTRNVALLPEIEQLPWRELQLQPVIVFDSNWRNNTQVSLAINRLAGALLHRVPGIAPPVHLPLPPRNEETDWGFDDARVVMGDEWARTYLDGDGVPVDASPRNAALVEVNSEVVWVHEVSRIVHMDEGHQFSPAIFKHGAYANRVVFETAENGQARAVSVADSWLKWNRRNEVHRLVYEPGQERLRAPHWFNMWKGMGCEPSEGDVAPFLEVLDNNIADPAMRQWLCRWLAYPLQNLGAKLLTNAVLVGPPGTGKSWLCELMGHIYGDNYIEIGREQLESNFNSVYHTKQFVNINEVTRSSSRERSLSANNKLKQLTTSPTLVVNKKNEAEWTCTNHVNIIITTNYADGLFLDEKDRRSAVLDWRPKVDHRNDRAYWERLYKWRDGEGAAALYHWLLSLDLSGFDAAGWAPHTDAKEDMIESARMGWEVWIMELAKAPDLYLPPDWAGREIFTNKELRTLCAVQLETEVERIGNISFGTQLKAHFPKANWGRKVKPHDGIPETYYVVRGDAEAYKSHEACCRNIGKKKYS
jgi:hypothetical protein